MANEMRDRLVELLDATIIVQEEKALGDIADHLIKNGVIVPPCKVGDIVYAIWKNDIYKAVVDKIPITIKKEKPIVWLEVIIKEKNGGFTFSKDLLFGCSVFLTREEAEQKLKGGIKE